jgi:hypothetical protein
VSANIYLPHLFVIPEDDANRDIVNGFRNHSSVKYRQIQVQNVAGGWRKALKALEDEQGTLVKYEHRYILILIDLDGAIERLKDAKQNIPDFLKDRVFIMGSLETPERLSAHARMSKEKIGEALAEECLGGGSGLWKGDLLRHNEEELQRMQRFICHYLIEK